MPAGRPCTQDGQWLSSGIEQLVDRGADVASAELLATTNDPATSATPRTLTAAIRLLLMLPPASDARLERHAFVA